MPILRVQAMVTRVLESLRRNILTAPEQKQRLGASQSPLSGKSVCLCFLRLGSNVWSCFSLLVTLTARREGDPLWTPVQDASAGLGRNWQKAAENKLPKAEDQRW